MQDGSSGECWQRGSVYGWVRVALRRRRYWSRKQFRMIGVRMAKTIGVNDGGGTIRNSEGAINEKEILWKQAKWVDYSGIIANEKLEGITLFDHPNNPNFPTYFHVRNDGWMGASLTFDSPRKIESDKPLHLSYGLYVHRGTKPPEAINAVWTRFTQIQHVKKN